MTGIGVAMASQQTITITIMEPQVLNTTIKVTRKGGRTIITDGNGGEWKFSRHIDSSTAIASLVYQTIYRNFDVMTCYSGDFEIEFTMTKKNNG